MTKKRGNGELVPWTALRIRALAAEGSVIIDGIDIELETLRRAAQIDEQTYLEFLSLIRSIRDDMGTADGNVPD